MLLSCNAVSKQFGAVTALDGVNLAVGSGEAVALWGRNGSGKSTCLQLIAGLLRPTSGTVDVMGGDPARDPAIRRRIGYAGEPGDLLGELTPAESLWYLVQSRNSCAGAEEEIERLLGAAQLIEKRGELIRNLSEGMRRKFGLIQAMVCSPPLLVLDEPTSGLDLDAQETFAALLSARVNQGASLIIATHDYHLIETLQPRIILLDAGRVRTDAALKDLLRAHECSGARELFVALDQRNRATPLG